MSLRWIQRTTAALALSALSLGLGGCVSRVLAHLAVKAPNEQRVPRVVRDPAYAARFDRTYAQAWRLTVGPPAAELAVAVVEPGDYQFRYRVTVQVDANGRRRLVPESEWTRPDQPAAETPKPIDCRGTILALHGYMDTKENMMHWALYLAQQGFRVVLVDLRGHGRSTGNAIGYGAFEARDVSQVIDELARRGLAGSTVGVLGVSYGASTGLLLAARDSRVAAVVALEPFSNAEQAVVEFAHGVAPERAAKISAAEFDAALARAPKIGGFAWKDADVLAAMAAVKVPVLFYHGAKDRWLSPENSRRLAAAAPAGSRLQILENDDHVLLSMRLTPIATDVSAWFATRLAAAPANVAAAGQR
jgi:pimeloyl-ACP methyl ester carboxylesterase